MKRRFVAIVLVTLAVLFCQKGGVVLAAICPHLRAQHESCHAMSRAVESPEMQHASGAAFETSDAGLTCNHCVVTAGNKRDDSAMQEANASQRASDVAVSHSLPTANPAALTKAVTWVAKAHGPPRDTAPLYLLLNVFRI
jgi:hypothetical protein